MFWFDFPEDGTAAELLWAWETTWQESHTAVLVLVSRLLVFLQRRNMGTEMIHFHSNGLSWNWPLCSGPQHCFGRQTVPLCGVDYSSSFFFFFFQLLNLVPQSNTEACIFLVTPELLNSRSFFFVAFCVCLCLFNQEDFFPQPMSKIKDFCFLLFEKHLHLRAPILNQFLSIFKCRRLPCVRKDTQTSVQTTFFCSLSFLPLFVPPPPPPHLQQLSSQYLMFFGTERAIDSSRNAFREPAFGDILGWRSGAKFNLTSGFCFCSWAII